MIKKSLLALGFLLLSTNYAFAVDLKNEDNKPHQIKVVEDGKVIMFQIDPNKTEYNVCQSVCSIELQGEVLGAVGSNVVTIKKGKLFGASQMCPKQVCTSKGCETQYYSASSCPLAAPTETAPEKK